MIPHVTRTLSQLVSEEHRLEVGKFWNLNFPAIKGDHHPNEITFAAQNLQSHDIQYERVTSEEQPEAAENVAWYR